MARRQEDGVEIHDSVEHADILREACDFFDVTKGRAAQYVTLLSEFNTGKGRSADHIQSINESFDLVDIYRFWKPCIAEFPGLKEKIRRTFAKGSLLSEQEKSDGSKNRARNDAFVYYLAGRLLCGNAPVTEVDGITRAGYMPVSIRDINLEFSEGCLSIECKRPKSAAAVVRNVKGARHDLRGATGVVAIDCSAFLTPPHKVYESDSEREAFDYLGKQVDSLVTPPVTRPIRGRIVGLILSARMPTMSRAEKSQVLDLSGRPVVKRYRPGSVLYAGIWTSPSKARDSRIQALHDALRRVAPKG